MSTRAALLLALSWTVGSASACGAPGRETTPPYPTAQVTLAGTELQVEVANSFERRAQGLSGRAELPAGHGMLFPYSRPDRYGFWMHGMRFDIDIVWIRGGQVVDVTSRAPHRVAPPLPVYRPREPADLVLEVPAGTAERLGWGPGTPVAVRTRTGPWDPRRAARPAARPGEASR